jgi:hypothetical protein
MLGPPPFYVLLGQALDTSPIEDRIDQFPARLKDTSGRQRCQLAISKPLFPFGC